jgi:hypothetical protein
MFGWENLETARMTAGGRTMCRRPEGLKTGFEHKGDRS